MNLGKRDRTKAKNPPFRSIFSYQCCPQNLSIIRVKIKQHPSTFCQRPHNMAISKLSAFAFRQKSQIFWFEIDPGVCSFWDFEDYYVFVCLSYCSYWSAPLRRTLSASSRNNSADLVLFSSVDSNKLLLFAMKFLFHIFQGILVLY